MNIRFDDPDLQDLCDLFNSLDPEEAIFMNHYELSRQTGIPADRWKSFLMHPRVSTWMEQEIQLYKEFQLKQMIRDATANDRSVGAAQMINSLTKALQEGTQKEGPIIVYTYVPMTEAQRQGTSIETIELSEDVLAHIPEEWVD